MVTIGAILCMAAHLEGKGVTALDMAGLAQKGGSVWSHVRIAADPDQLWAPRIAAGEADAVIGCDIVVTVSDESLAKMQLGPDPGRGQQRRSRSPASSCAPWPSRRAPATSAASATPSSRPGPMEDQIVDAVGAGRRLVPGCQPTSPPR